jgi:hypothetical protein
MHWRSAYVNVHTISKYLLIAMCLAILVICYCNLQCLPVLKGSIEPVSLCEMEAALQDEVSLH